MNDLQQFVGGTIQSITRDGNRSVSMVIRLPDGNWRDLTVYEPHDVGTVSVRIDGMYVPPEEL